ncbi:MAG: DUF5709 domain-containing protein [Actinomycetota bacterium]|nr:DUF5709 domain-containing protein [Actinomycetota bacterium]
MTGPSQAPKEDTLVDRGVEDVLDEGYSPPERMPASHLVGTTAAEQRDGETWDQRLVQEVEELDPYAVAALEEPTTWDTEVTGGERTGRLVAPDEGAHEDVDKDEFATDVGIDGGAASAEEAAMHLVPELPEDVLAQDED